MSGIPPRRVSACVVANNFILEMRTAPPDALSITMALAVHLAHNVPFSTYRTNHSHHPEQGAWCVFLLGADAVS